MDKSDFLPSTVKFMCIDIAIKGIPKIMSLTVIGLEAVELLFGEVSQQVKGLS